MSDRDKDTRKIDVFFDVVGMLAQAAGPNKFPNLKNTDFEKLGKIYKDANMSLIMAISKSDDLSDMLTDENKNAIFFTFLEEHHKLSFSNKPELLEKIKPFSK